MRVAWEQGNPQIKVIFCYAVLITYVGTGTSMAGQAMAGSFFQLICPTWCYLCLSYVTFPGLSTLKLQGPVPPQTTLNTRHPRYIRQFWKSPLSFHLLKQPLNSRHPTTPYNGQFSRSQLYTNNTQRDRQPTVSICLTRLGARSS